MFGQKDSQQCRRIKRKNVGDGHVSGIYVKIFWLI